MVGVIGSAAHGGGVCGHRLETRLLAGFRCWPRSYNFMCKWVFGSEESICEAWSGGSGGFPPDAGDGGYFFRPNLEASIQNTGVQKSFHINFLTPMGKK